MTRRSAAHRLLEPGSLADIPSVLIDVLIVTLILADVTCIVLGTLPGMEDFAGFFEAFEWFVLGVFGLEYALRLWSCVEDGRFARPFLGRALYVVTPLAIADLLAILPAVTLLPGLAGLIPIELSATRLLRLARLTKLTRYMASVRTLGRALWRVRNELGAFAALTVLLIIVASIVMWGVEKEANPEQFGSIPQAMWWAIVTMTTVGYGDVTPITPIGRLVASGVMIFGIGMFALPAGLLGAAFTEEVRREFEHKKILRKRRLRRADRLRVDKITEGVHVICPHCDKPFIPTAEEFHGPPSGDFQG